MTSPPAASRPHLRGARRELFSWALYDVANSAFTTLVVTFIYATYFTQAMGGDEVRATSSWLFTNSVAAGIVAVLSPVLGAITDARGRRKPALAFVTAQCILATTALAFVTPPHWRLALVLFLIANVGYELGQVLYNAFLPEIAPPGRIGRMSGYGWALGYAGGLVCLGIALTMTGLPGVLKPWLSTEAGWNIRATNVLTAAWFLAFAPPLFLFVRERATPSGLSAGRAVAQSFRRIAATWRELRRFRQAARFLAARLFYNDGLVVVFAFGAIFAKSVFGMSHGEIVLLGIWLNVTAAIGSVLLGHMDDRLGGKRSILVTLVVLIAATFLGSIASTKAWFWVAATGIGFMVGPNQAASRSLMARFIPPARRGQFFGFFALSGRATSFLGYLTAGEVIRLTGSHRLGMISLTLFFATGLILLLSVDEAAGIAAAGADGAEPAAASTREGS